MIFRSRNHKYLSTLIIITVLFAASCDEFGLFDNLESDPSIRIVVDDGVLYPGETLDLRVEYTDNPPDRMTARLEKKGGAPLPLDIEPPFEGWNNQPGDLGVLALPVSIPEGHYVLVTEAWSGEKLLAEERLDSTVIYGDWEFYGLELFPPQTVPGGFFYAQTVLEIPEKSDPWLRWLQDDQVVAEGLLSDGWNEVVLRAGEKPGMGSLAVELHLDTPEEKERPIRVFATELYINSSLPEDPDSLGPHESYSVLLHFDGTLGNDPQPQLLGKPKPVVAGKGTGFRFTDGDGLRWDDIDLPPFDSLDREPFSIHFGLIPEWGSPGRILTIADEDNFSLIVEMSGSDNLSLLVNNDLRYSSSLPISGPEKDPLNITISFLPSVNGLELNWKIDGDTVAIEQWASSPDISGDKVRLELGGDGGFSGVLTEFGIHVTDVDGNPSAEGDRFEFYQTNETEMKIVEGFEDEVIHPDIEIGSKSFIDGGSLLMPPDSILRFPAGGGGQLAIRELSGGDTAVLTMENPETGDVSETLTLNEENYVDSYYRILIPLEKKKSMSDNDMEVIYQLKASSQNRSDLQLEHILVPRE